MDTFSTSAVSDKKFETTHKKSEKKFLTIFSVNTRAIQKVLFENTVEDLDSAEWWYRVILMLKNTEIFSHAASNMMLYLLCVFNLHQNLAYGTAQYCTHNLKDVLHSILLLLRMVYVVVD